MSKAPAATLTGFTQASGSNDVQLTYPEKESAMRSQVTLEKKSGKKKKGLGRRATVFEAKRVYPYEDGCFSIGT
jgi:hypothetical protein